MEATFNDVRVRDALSRLQPHQQVAFGASSCERMLPNYKSFMREAAWGDLEPLRGALDLVWSGHTAARPPKEVLSALAFRCEQTAPDSDDFKSFYVSSAQDAVFAVCALIDFLIEEDLDHLIRVPRLSTDSVDLFVQELEHMNPSDPLREKKILEHPLMQQELKRQMRDIDEAGRILLGDEEALLRLRTRAQQESNLLLDIKKW